MESIEAHYCALWEASYELFGTLLKRVAVMYSGLIHSAFGTTIPPSGMHTRLAPFFFFFSLSEERGKHVWDSTFPTTFPCLSKRAIDRPDKGTSKGQHERQESYGQDISCLSQEKFMKDASSRSQKLMSSLMLPRSDGYITRACWNNIVELVPVIRCLPTLLL